ncbi:MAG: choice-of-anchor J domain-containing protein [bacterium]|nr:choice-of-anchor J domain-containing protein [bacterium]
MCAAAGGAAGRQGLPGQSGTEPGQDGAAGRGDPGRQHPGRGLRGHDLPAHGWARLHLSTSYTWARSTASHNTGVACAYQRYGPASITQNEWLVTPALDFSALTNPKLEFYEASPYWGDYGEHHYVMVSTTSQTDPAQFARCWHWTPLNHAINENAFGATPAMVNLAAFAGQPSSTSPCGTWAATPTTGTSTTCGSTSRRCTTWRSPPSRPTCSSSTPRKRRRPRWPS